jgi:hypothetical protein
VTEVSRTLKVGQHAQNGYDQTQISGHRRLLRQEHQRAFLDVEKDRVYLVVAFVDLASQLVVALDQGRCDQLGALLDQRTHAHDLSVEALELLVE